MLDGFLVVRRSLHSSDVLQHTSWLSLSAFPFAPVRGSESKALCLGALLR